MDLPGKTLGNYRIDRLLGKGSIGDVYQAHDLPMQRDVAFKVIHSRYARQPNFREHFPREVSAAAQMDHPGMVKVLDFGQHRDQLYVVTEYIPGANLRELLDELIRQREWLSLNDAVRMIEQLCQTVEYAHQREAIGWDLNPTNLLLKPEPANGLPFRVVLTDLRLAKLVERSENDQEEASLDTPAYMSPEQVLGRPTDARSDIYSLGVLLYEFVVGIPPFPIKTLSDAVLYHSGESLPEPRSLRPDLPAGVEQVILKALDKEPENRYVSAAELEMALAESMRDLTQIVELEGAQDGNLFKRYEESLGEPLHLESTRLMSEDESGRTELQSAFATAPSEILPIYQIIIQVSLAGRLPQTLTLPGESVTIGREKGNDLVLDDPKISRRHAQLTQDGPNCYVVDLNSANGTYLENARLQPGTPTIWRPNQELRIGGASLRLMSQAQGGTVAESYHVGPRTTMERFGGEPMVATVTPQQLSVEAGAGVTATLSLLNQIPDAEYFSVSLTGIPNDWVGSLPSHVQLMPGEQKVISFTIHVPRTPQSRAGRHAITIMVANSNDPSQFVELKMALTVAAYSQFKAELQPEHLRPEQIGRVTIANVGNIQETFTVQFTDPNGNLAFEPPQLQMRIPEARSAYMEFRAREKQLRVVGGEQSYPFSAHISLTNGETQTLHSELLSRGFVPVWVLPTVLLLCLFFTGIAGALWLISFNRLTTLTVLKNGDGTVTSLPVGIDCGSSCSFNFSRNTTVTLNANPTSPSTFGGWSGACSGSLLNCEVKMTEAQTVTATFNPPGTQTLIVNKTGTGSGTVTSSPAGINNCSDPTCSYAFAENTSVTLTANPIPPATFGGWSGACSGTGPCTVTMSAVQTVTVTFNLPGKQTLILRPGGTGTGTVTSSPAGINCGSTCAFDFAENTVVTLTANPVSPSTFGGWSGACSGTSLTCIITMNTAQNVTATFNGPGNQTLTVTKFNTGTGRVTSSPIGIDCGSTCSSNFSFGLTVTLTAVADPGSTFVGWGGACSGTGSCIVTMNATQNVTATFNPPGSQRLTVTKLGLGNGTVTSAPAGINSCSTSCFFDFSFGQMVTLIPSSDASSIFVGWGGACSGTGNCIVTMNTVQTVTATFNLKSGYP